jgi:hypothetical protein
MSRGQAWRQRFQPFVVVVLAFVCFALGFGVLASLSSQANVRRAALEVVGNYPADGRDFPRVLSSDHYSDCALIIMSVFHHTSVLLDAVDTILVYDDWKLHPCEHLSSLLLDGAPFDLSKIDEKYEYSRYWFGARHLFQFMAGYISPHPNTIRLIYQAATYTLLLALVVLGWFRGRGFGSVFCGIPICLLAGLGLSAYGTSVAHAPAYICALTSTVLFVVFNKRLQSSSSRLAFVFGVGAMIVYFDILSGALPFALSLLLFVNYFLYTRESENPVSVSTQIARHASIVLAFGAGCLMSCALRLAAAFALYSPQLVTNHFWAQAAWRLSSRGFNGAQITLGSIFSALWEQRSLFFYGSETLATAVLSTLAVCWLVAVIAMTAIAVQRRTHAILSDLLALLLTAGVVLGWYTLLPNHTTIHAWIVGRLMIVPASVGFAGIVLVVWWLRRPRASALVLERELHQQRAC